MSASTAYIDMAITAIYTVNDTKRMAHVHVKENGNDVATFVVTFTNRANLRTKLQTVLTEFSAELTRIRGEV
jgi:hypothetical protein